MYSLYICYWHDLYLYPFFFSYVHHYYFCIPMWLGPLSLILKMFYFWVVSAVQQLVVNIQNIHFKMCLSLVFNIFKWVSLPTRMNLCFLLLVLNNQSICVEILHESICGVRNRLKVGLCLFVCTCFCLCSRELGVPETCTNMCALCLPQSVGDGKAGG